MAKKSEKSPSPDPIAARIVSLFLLCLCCLPLAFFGGFTLFMWNEGGWALVPAVGGFAVTVPFIGVQLTCLYVIVVGRLPALLS